MAAADGLQQTADRADMRTPFLEHTLQYHARRHVRGRLLLSARRLRKIPQDAECRRVRPARGMGGGACAASTCPIWRGRPPNAATRNSHGSRANISRSPSAAATATRAALGTASPSRSRTRQASPIYGYQGNWRDIFQNWESLAQSYPGLPRRDDLRCSSTPRPPTATTLPHHAQRHRLGGARPRTTRGATSAIGATTRSSTCCGCWRATSGSSRAGSRRA